MSGHLVFGLGGLTAQTRSHGRPAYGAALRSVVDLAIRAEVAGFDSVWTSEHHFIDDGYLPSPIVVMAAIGERTRRVTIGTQVLLAPLYSPVKLAEDTAVLDQLCGGRLALGIGLGYQGQEYATFGVRPGGRVAAFEQCIATLRAAWGDEPIGCDTEGPRVRPLPLQDPGPPILVGAIAEAGVRRAARLADGYVAPMMSINGFRRRVDWLVDEGIADDFAVGAYMHAFIADGDAWAVARESVGYVEQQYATWQQAHRDFDQFHTVDRGELEAPPGHLIIGGVEELVDRLRPWCALLDEIPGHGDRHIIVRLTYPGLDDSIGAAAVEAFGAHVATRLRAERP